MFDKQELNQLKEVVQATIHETVPQMIGQALEDVVLPRFEAMDQQFEGVDRRFEGIDQRLNRIEANMVTKDFLEDRLADFRLSLADSADWVGRQLKRLTHVMYHGKLLTAEQLIEIHGA